MLDMKFSKNEFTIIHGEYFSKCGTKLKLHTIVTTCVTNPFEDAYFVQTHIKINMHVHQPPNPKLI